MERQMYLEVVPAPAVEPSAFDVVAEANHRIANNLSIISGWVRIHGAAICKEPRMMSGDDVRLILEEVGGRLDAVARLHRLLAAGRHEAPINIADFLREIVERAVSALSIGGATELQFDFGLGCYVPPEKALALGLITGELVTNAVKYAHPAGVAGQIRLACRRNPDDSITIDLSDDGVGLPEGVDPMKNGHFGFRVVRSLVDQLGATMTYHSDSLGLLLMLHLPASSAA
jgi:two-component sensor histidine kinase